MSRPILVAVAFAAFAVMPGACRELAAHGVRSRTVDIVHPWTFETAGVASTVEVFMRLKSRDKRGDRLVTASSPRAARVELRGPGGAAGDAPFTIEIEAGRTVELSPSGPRLVLHGVDKALSPYDTFPLTLVFARAGRIVVEVLVEERQATPPPPSAEHPLQPETSKETKQ